jgi:hypothetical protein
MPDLVYPIDWFAVWSGLWTGILTNMRELPELSRTPIGLIADLRLGVLFTGSLLLEERTTDSDSNDVVITTGMRLDGAGFRWFFFADFDDPMSQFAGSKLLLRRLPDPASFRRSFESYFEHNLEDLRGSGPWTKHWNLK